MQSPRIARAFSLALTLVLLALPFAAGSAVYFGAGDEGEA